MGKVNYEGSEQYRPISAWGYVGYTILFCIPLIGLIFLIIYSFSNKNLNRKNYARSYFCALLILLFITVVLATLIYFNVGNLQVIINNRFYPTPTPRVTEKQTTSLGTNQTTSSISIKQQPTAQPIPSSTSIPTVIPTVTPTVKPVSSWELLPFKDKFGDPTGDYYIHGGSFTGSVTNTGTTTSSKINIEVFCLYDDTTARCFGVSRGQNGYLLMLRISKGTQIITHHSSQTFRTAIYSISMKDQKNEIHLLKGIMRNNSSDMVIALWDDYSNAQQKGNYTNYSKGIIDIFRKGGQLKFSVSNDSDATNTYVFEINTDGFNNLYNKLR